MMRCSNAYILLDREDGEVIVKAYEDYEDNVMMREVSKHICFSDCDDTFVIIKVIYHGREVKYVGWQPNMKYEYKFVATGDVAWCSWHPEWDH